MSHTPGPWEANGSEMTLATWVVGPDGKRICTMRECEHDYDNARLIAAAPELLDALKTLEAAVRKNNFHAVTCAFDGGYASAAIAKAEGK